MKNKSFILLLLLPIFAMAFQACSNAEPTSLSAKKSILEAKKKELIALNKEIDLLQAEIRELDPELANQVRKIPVGTMDIAASKFQHYVKVQGQVEANKNILVSAMQPGRITAIYVKEGQYVKKGALLAQLDDAVMKSSLAEVQSSLDLAEIMFNKQQKLWDQEIGTEVQYLTAKNQKESLEKRLATLKEQLKLSKIYAPISGAVDEIMPKVGEMLNPGFPAFRIVNASDLSLKADVSEVHLPYIKRGDKVKLSFPTIDIETEAKVSSVGQSINPNNRTFKVEVKLPNNPLFKSNMFGQISVNDQNIDDAVVIPLELIQQTDIGQFVYVVEKDTTGTWLSKRKNIKTGLSSEGSVLVESGLKAGEKLVNRGYKDLSDGQAVSLEESLANN